MTVSIYTFVKDGLFFDYHMVEMLKHHLPLADEIIVNEGYSSDDTFKAISNLDPKVKIFRSHWGQPREQSWLCTFKDNARQRCAGDWCILLDCDEFIPDWEFDSLRKYLEETAEIMVPVRVVNFYGNYRVYNAHPEKHNWPARKMIIHRNLPQIEVWGDGSNIRLRNTKLDWNSTSREFTCHHFGGVRIPARLREKWRNIFGRMYTKTCTNWIRLPSFLFNRRPHDWMDSDFLADLTIYDGPFIRAVRENPDEFVRDSFILYEYLKTKNEQLVDCS